MWLSYSEFFQLHNSSLQKTTRVHIDPFQDTEIRAPHTGFAFPNRTPSPHSSIWTALLSSGCNPLWPQKRRVNTFTKVLRGPYLVFQTFANLSFLTRSQVPSASPPTRILTLELDSSLPSVPASVLQVPSPPLLAWGLLTNARQRNATNTSKSDNVSTTNKK